MYRDFSEKSKNELLSGVSQVENGDLSDFTDWVGDRWCDYEYWIQKMNIRYYLDSVNQYHKKVVEKSNATKNSIKMVFEKVHSTDTACADRLSQKKLELQQWKRYLDELSQIVSPSNGEFHLEYTPANVVNILDEIWKGRLDDYFSYASGRFINEKEGLQTLFRMLTSVPSMSENVKTGFTFPSAVGAGIGKYGNINKASLDSSVVKSISSLCGITSVQNCSNLNVVSSFISQFKSSVAAEKALYEYFEKTLHPYEAVKLDSKFGKYMIGLSIASDAANLIDSLIKSYQAFVDSEGTIFDKAAEIINSAGASFKLFGDSYIASQAGSKVLQFVNNTAGSKKVVNQILATSQELKYTFSSDALKGVSKAATCVAIVDVVTATVSDSVKRAGEVLKDGKIDMIDVGSIGIYGSMGGLSEVASELFTLGTIDFDGEKAAAHLENDASEFAKGDSWAANIIRDKKIWAPARFAVSVGAGAYILGENVIEGAGNGAKTVGSWVSTGWNTVVNFFN